MQNTAAVNALRTLPRDTWSSHPRFPAQTLLLQSHESFLEVSGVLIAAARGGESMELIETLFDRWISAMRSHEAYEEAKLYPYLERRWGLSFDAAEAGHRDLHRACDQVKAAFAKGPSSPSEVVAALEHHDAVLRPHLELEEDLVIPGLLELSPEEFAHYYDSDIQTLLHELEAREG
ncbi:MAG: hemerythrin domain-containing protein [Myxococcota bacterium]